jgi:hypothetical protein
MLDFASALERSAQFRSKLAAMETALKARPDDRGLRITLLSTKRSAERAEQDVLAAASHSQIDLCRYRIIRTANDTYPASHIAASISSYQDLFTALYNYVKTGPSSSANYSRDIKKNSLLNLAYTYPGSLGVVLTIDNALDLFGDGELDKIIKALQDVTSIRSQEYVKQVADKMGLNVVRKVFAWADINWISEFSVDVQWKKSTDQMSGGFISRQTFLDISSAINQTSDEEPIEIDVVGTLVGYNVLRETFAITTDDEATYSGRLSEEFDRKKVYKIPFSCRAKITAIKLTKYAAESSVMSYRLSSLSDV